MRKGPLAEHPVEQVLRTAAAERLNGQIDLDGTPSATIFLVDGQVALACWSGEVPVVDVDHALDDAAYSRAVALLEQRLRADTVEVLRQVEGRAEGWYYHHPLGEHAATLLWGWDVDDLLTPEPTPGAELDPATPAEATMTPPARLALEQMGEGPPSLGRPGVTAWRLAPGAPAEPLDDAAWGVLALLAGPIGRDELVHRLGWTAEQVDIVTSSLQARGALVPDEVDAR